MQSYLLERPFIMDLTSFPHYHKSLSWHFLLIYVFFLLPASEEDKAVCTTVGGASSNKPCIFPFRFNGALHTSCIWDMAHLTEHKAWCSTLVDDSGHHVGGQGKWGNCGPGCPIPPDNRNQTSVPGKPQFLPFY